jgi:prepilin-type N-terminal cleavage/methylation domain-containing protein
MNLRPATRFSFRPLFGERGYTLMEMVVAISIIAILTALVVANTRVGNKRQELRDAAAGYVTAARNAEALASGAQPVAGSSRKAYGLCLTTSQALPGGHCVAVPSGQRADAYQVFARRTAETQTSALAAIGLPPDNPDIVASFTLPRDLEFATPGFYLDYLPPAPALRVTGQQPDRISLTIRIVGHTNCAGSADCKNIVIRPRAGAVYVE